MVKRDFYLNRIKRSMWNGEIKVITGIRRCGKSTLLFEIFHDYLTSQGIDDRHIIKLALDQRRNYQFRDPIVLCDFVEDLLTKSPDEKYYLLIDEVQYTTTVKDIEHGGIEVTIYDMLNELKSYKNLDVYVTGSNSKGLSSDIATEFRGRATQIHVHPLSFEEYFSAVEGEESHALQQYMLYGGMPRLLELDDEIDKKDYLMALYNEVYIKDIVERNRLDRQDMLNEILDYLASQISSLTNPNNIAHALSSIRKEQVNSNLIAKYIDYLIDAFLITKAQRYDVKGKSYFNYPHKYYFTDVGLRNARLSYRQYDPGHLMENIIYNELIRQGYSVDVGVVYDRTGGKNVQKEIDFVVNHADQRVYIQSALQLDTATKTSTELRSLTLSGDFFRKIIIRNDIPHNYNDEQGIYHVNLTDFLLHRINIF